MRTLLVSYGSNLCPVGLVEIYYYLKDRGYDSEYINLETNVDKLNEVSVTPDIVGISVITINSDHISMVIKKVRGRWPKARVVLGGKHFNSDILELEKERLIKEADHVVIGDGEYVLQDLMDGKALDKVVTGTPLVEKDYKETSLPSKDFIAKWLPKRKHAWLFTRGCPYNCVFCCDRRVPLLRKDPDVVAKRVEDLSSWFGHKMISLYDDVFSVNNSWLHQFNESRKNYDVKLDIFIHGAGFNSEMLSTLKDSGVVKMNLGAESGDNDILKLVDKKTTVEDYIRIYDLVKAAGGVTLHTLWMLGNIGETKETMRKTVELSKKISMDGSWFSYAVPFPGTKFWKVADQYGKIVNRNFSSWKNTTIVFVPSGTTKEEMLFWKGKIR